MNSDAMDLWERAKKALLVARNLLALDSDATASRAYYDAFYAVSAWFALSDKTFKRHSAVEAAVHRDLVRPGIWSKSLGKRYSQLVEFRMMGDYGSGLHVSSEEAKDAVSTADDVLCAIAKMKPEAFTELERN